EYGTGLRSIRQHLVHEVPVVPPVATAIAGRQADARVAGLQVEARRLEVEGAQQRMAAVAPQGLALGRLEDACAEAGAAMSRRDPEEVDVEIVPVRAPGQPAQNGLVGGAQEDAECAEGAWRVRDVVSAHLGGDEAR